jgi:5-methylcytosine-specific restriction endonuclease McrA
VHLLRYDRTPRVTVRLTRRNLMFRDAHQCQYCGKRPPLRELNIDHVLPRSRGGADSCENLVTACRVCNLRKGWKTPEEANMRLARRPFRPKWTMTAQILLGSGWKFKEWEPFLKAAS